MRSSYSYKILLRTYLNKKREYLKYLKKLFKYKYNFIISVYRIKKPLENIPSNKKEIRLFAVFQNESLRLSYFLEYYKKLGVDRFFLIDNNSNDDYQFLLQNYENVHVFHTKESFKKFWFWVQFILERYGKNNWCIVVDIDELFQFPNSNKINIKKLVDYLNANNYQAIRCLLIDVYSNKNLNEIEYSKGQNPLEILTHFDKNYEIINFNFENKKTFRTFKSLTFIGGMRKRVFGEVNPPHLLSKIPLFKNSKNSYLTDGMHAIDKSKFCDIQGAVIHTKFSKDFINEVINESLREEHFGNAFYYKHYKSTIDNHKNLNLYCEDSIEYKDNDQLINLGLMKTSERFESFCQSIQ